MSSRLLVAIADFALALIGVGFWSAGIVSGCEYAYGRGTWELVFGIGCVLASRMEWHR